MTSFKLDGFPMKFNVSKAYTQKNVHDVVRPYQSRVGPRYSETLQFDRGHLTPRTDELFPTWQWSTYFYINVAGMWNAINNRNWRKVENSVRSFAGSTRRNFEIFTGTYGISQLCEDCPNFILANGTIPVAKWVWKIVKDPNENKAIALVISNNPFMRVPRICGEAHNTYGWNQEGFDNFTRGEVSICTVQQLRSVVGYIPQAAEAHGVLENVSTV